MHEPPSAQSLQPDSTPPDAAHEQWELCSWHGSYSATARLIQVIEQGSGISPGLYTCAACRADRRLVPLSELPADEQAARTAWAHTARSAGDDEPQHSTPASDNPSGGAGAHR